MKAEIKAGKDAREFDTPERCFITEVANDTGDDQVSIARARVEPGVTTQWHKLKGVTERYIITQGKGRMELGDMEPVDVQVGDVVRIPEDIRQRITNTGDSDLLFYAVCSPPFANKNYESLE